MNDNRPPARALNCHIQGKRNRGRIPKRGLTTSKIKEDVRDLGVRQATDATEDRVKWKNIMCIGGVWF